MYFDFHALKFVLLVHVYDLAIMSCFHVAGYLSCIRYLH
jgi:hypothetical protein